MVKGQKQAQDAFEKARRVLYENHEAKTYTKFYQS